MYRISMSARTAPYSRNDAWNTRRVTCISRMQTSQQLSVRIQFLNTQCNRVLPLTNSPEYMSLIASITIQHQSTKSIHQSKTSRFGGDQNPFLLSVKNPLKAFSFHTYNSVKPSLKLHVRIKRRSEFLISVMIIGACFFQFFVKANYLSSFEWDSITRILKMRYACEPFDLSV